MLAIQNSGKTLLLFNVAYNCNLNVFFCLFPILKSASVADAIMEFSGGVLTVYGQNETASIFATYPSEYLTLGRSFLDQVRVYQN